MLGNIRGIISIAMQLQVVQCAINLSSEQSRSSISLSRNPTGMHDKCSRRIIRELDLVPIPNPHQVGSGNDTLITTHRKKICSSNSHLYTPSCMLSSPSQSILSLVYWEIRGQRLGVAGGYG